MIARWTDLHHTLHVNDNFKQKGKKKTTLLGVIQEKLNPSFPSAYGIQQVICRDSRLNCLITKLQDLTCSKLKAIYSQFYSLQADQHQFVQFPNTSAGSVGWYTSVQKGYTDGDVVPHQSLDGSEKQPIGNSSLHLTSQYPIHVSLLYLVRQLPVVKHSKSCPVSNYCHGCIPQRKSNILPCFQERPVTNVDWRVLRDNQINQCIVHQKACMKQTLRFRGERAHFSNINPLFALYDVLFPRALSATSSTCWCDHE